MPRVFAYCRVSTQDQTTDNQTQEIAAAGFIVEPKRAVVETVSGSVPASERPGFRQLLNKLERGDVLVVTKLDRLGRNAMDVRATVESLALEGVRVHCLALGGVVWSPRKPEPLGSREFPQQESLREEVQIQ